MSAAKSIVDFEWRLIKKWSIILENHNRVQNHQKKNQTFLLYSSEKKVLLLLVYLHGKI